jgi:hypothetical protein
MSPYETQDEGCNTITPCRSDTLAQGTASMYGPDASLPALRGQDVDGCPYKQTPQEWVC